MYHISVADEHCGLLAAFLLDEEYTFVGVDINNDQKNSSVLAWRYETLWISRICGECLIQ